MVQGLVWPAGTGGVIGQTHSLEVFTKPTVQDYLTDFATGGRIPHPFSSDTKARAPAWSEGACCSEGCCWQLAYVRSYIADGPVIYSKQVSLHS